MNTGSFTPKLQENVSKGGGPLLCQLESMIFNENVVYQIDNICKIGREYLKLILM